MLTTCHRLEGVVHSVLACRVLLNIRRHAQISESMKTKQQRLSSLRFQHSYHQNDDNTPSMGQLSDGVSMNEIVAIEA
jgi:hypothetical protein